jgi:proteasome lid subunit RPN8/RPN11
VLTISAEIRDAIVAHAQADHPDEACGFLVGPAGSDVPARHVAMTNVERSPTFHQMDPAELLTLFKEMDAADEEIVAHYHSHTATEPYPSRTDITYATEGGFAAHYVIASTRGAEDPNDPCAAEAVEVRAFRIADGVVTEEPLTVA